VRLHAAARLGASAALLWLAWQLAGGEAVLATLAGADPVWIAAALLLSVPMHAISAARWVFTCRRIGLRLGYRRALADYYLAALANMLLPGGVGGDAARVWRHARREREHAGLRAALTGVLLERAAGQVALALLLVAGIAGNWQRLHWLAALAAAIAILAAAAVAGLWLSARWPRAARTLAALAADARRAFLPAGVLAQQAAMSAAVVATYVAAFWCATWAVHAPLAAQDALLAIPLVLTAMTIPVSVGGLGLREASAAAVWPLLGLTASAGAAAALLYGLAMLAGCAPGALVLLCDRASPRHGHA